MGGRGASIRGNGVNVHGGFISNRDIETARNIFTHRVKEYKKEIRRAQKEIASLKDTMGKFGETTRGKSGVKERELIIKRHKESLKSYEGFEKLTDIEFATKYFRKKR